MKSTLNIVGGLLVIFGAIRFLQGINVLPGSFIPTVGARSPRFLRIAVWAVDRMG